MNSKVDQLNDTLKQPQQAMAHAKPLHDQAPAALSSSEIFVMPHKEIF